MAQPFILSPAGTNPAFVIRPPTTIVPAGNTPIFSGPPIISNTVPSASLFNPVSNIPYQPGFRDKDFLLEGSGLGSGLGSKEDNLGAVLQSLKSAPVISGPTFSAPVISPLVPVISGHVSVPIISPSAPIISGPHVSVIYPPAFPHVSVISSPVPVIPGPAVSVPVQVKAEEVKADKEEVALYKQWHLVTNDPTIHLLDPILSAARRREADPGPIPGPIPLIFPSGLTLKKEVTTTFLESDQVIHPDPNLVDVKLYSALQQIKDGYNFPGYDKVRLQTNPFEDISKSVFINRAAVKLANCDAIFNFTEAKGGSLLPFGDKNLIFCDLAGGPGGFTQYIQYRLSKLSTLCV